MNRHLILLSSIFLAIPSSGCETEKPLVPVVISRVPSSRGVGTSARIANQLSSRLTITLHYRGKEEVVDLAPNGSVDLDINPQVGEVFKVSHPNYRTTEWETTGKGT